MSLVSRYVLSFKITLFVVDASLQFLQTIDLQIMLFQVSTLLQLILKRAEQRAERAQSSFFNVNHQRIFLCSVYSFPMEIGTSKGILPVPGTTASRDYWYSNPTRASRVFPVPATAPQLSGGHPARRFYSFSASLLTHKFLSTCLLVGTTIRRSLSLHHQ